MSNKNFAAIYDEVWRLFEQWATSGSESLRWRLEEITPEDDFLNRDGEWKRFGDMGEGLQAAVLAIFGYTSLNPKTSIRLVKTANGIQVETRVAITPEPSDSSISEGETLFSTPAGVATDSTDGNAESESDDLLDADEIG